uniref:replication protein A 70 kDa DNA-binding subunit C-like n=1 Tax=Erigeron canadensis TaxID=72917 RepID=UPI001CB937E8|nr:replication protein A 70 kDa DNA-binding subunit C-like [Erigeron canadensis]
MGKGKAIVAKQPKERNCIFLNQVNKESTGPIVVMIRRRWDVISVKNKYMSTDYIISDAKGNVLHCFVKAAIAYRFKSLLEEGCLYMMNDFTVLSNPPKYSIMKDAEFMIEIDGSTLVTKQTADVDMFIRHPFQLTLQKSTGSQTVEFNLTNERGFQLRVTLWGGLGDNMVAKKRMNPGVYVILLTCMSSKEYLGNLCLSSSSSTLLIDDENIPAIKSFKAALSGVEIVDTGVLLLQVKATISSLHDLIEWGRTKSKKEAGAYQGSIQITNVRTRKGWFTYTCTSAKCRKSMEMNPSNVFWCDLCNNEVKYPRPRYRLQLEITDGTADLVVVLFDEVAEKLVGHPVRALITEAEQDETGTAFVLPSVLHELIGTSHVFEIKTHSYFHAGNIVVHGSEPKVDAQASSSNTMLDKILDIPTPANKNETSRIKMSSYGRFDDETDKEPSRAHGRKRDMENFEAETVLEELPKVKKQA